MRFKNVKTVHFSVDDTIWLFENLGHFHYSSIFEQPTLGFFNNLHKRFGLKVSFYCFGNFQGLSLSDMKDCYRAEFSSNSDWLRFGFHGLTDESTPPCGGGAQQDYAAVKRELVRITGEDSLTDFCRLHCFFGSRDTIKAMQKLGLRGLLCADDRRKNYYLSPLSNFILNMTGVYFDPTIRMQFLKTDLRIETSDMNACRNFSPGKRHLEIFTHEWALNEESKQKIEVICKKINVLGYRWVFNDEREKEVWYGKNKKAD